MSTKGVHCRPRSLRMKFVLGAVTMFGTHLLQEVSRRREACKHRSCVAMARLRSRKSGEGEAELRRDVGEDEKTEAEQEEEQEVVEEEEEDEEAGGNGEDQDKDEAITEYEKQRLKTIERNKAMLASLQLPGLASSLTQSTRAKSLGSISKLKGGDGPRRRSERLKSVTGKRR